VLKGGKEVVEVSGWEGSIRDTIIRKGLSMIYVTGMYECGVFHVKLGTSEGFRAFVCVPRGEYRRLTPLLTWEWPPD
jgi:hypothetical protein